MRHDNSLYDGVMATQGVSFESSSSIEERKEKKRQSRQEAIEKAKQQHEREERRKELKRQRGEDTWILPEVNQRLQQIEEEGSVKSKKKKEKKTKKKKEKKKKVKKEKKAEVGNDSSDSSQDSEEEWVEAHTQPAKAWKVQSKASEGGLSPAQNIQRDEWMTFDFLAMKTTSTAERRAEKDRHKEDERAKAQAIEQAGLHKLELNPYWKDGGTGLPPEDLAQTAAKRGPVVNDGGLSWLRKSYQRMKEQAEREQRTLSDIVAQRYGSMEEFQKRLADAETAAHGQSRDDRECSPREGWRKGDEDDRERWRRREQDQARGRKSERDLSPRDKYSYRRADERERHRGREVDRGRDGDRYRDRERGRDRGRDDENDKNRDREKERDSFRDKEKDVTTQASSSSSASLGSLKGRFLKPSEDDDTVEAPKRPPPTQSSARFLKPSSDDEDSPPKKSSGQAWKTCSTSEPDRAENPQESQTHSERIVNTPHVASSSRTESESEEEEEAEKEFPLLSEEEMNKLGSKLIKAEIMGNTAVIEKLKSQLEAAQKAKEFHAARRKEHEAAKLKQVTSHSREDQEVLLFRTDESGRAWPVKGPSGPQEPHGGRRKKKTIETHVDGERVRYFKDDDSIGLQEMVRREKMSSAQDQHALYSRMAAKMMGKTDGDNYTLDDMFVSGAAQREGEGREEERMRNRAIGESRRLAASMDKCPHCFSSQELPKHLIVAIGSKVYLSLPTGVSMTEGHCLICPLQHHSSATGLDEDVWSEMQLFRRALVRMFEAQELDCVFMETYMNPRRKQHMVLECIPLPRELGDMAPIYFKKAIMECDEEWAMNKKLVDLSSKDIRRAVPRGLPYFAVDFGLQGGFAHVIENEQKFPHYFGKEVVGGMMDLEPRRWRKLIRENFDDQRKKVLQFAQWWKPYDCTKTDG
ncbi:CWF19-like protein 2 isoform X2 [Girardinichthys multiradiatus]|uniref:CWF19-like protein 2 isoform X2 n=1 Tax=Girardinichthys multiradiatus TaxID=208333 RepID=UPI001FAD59B2|nr:CWF19-like protein 2 isoform X2 [Girardinichthys multiradiatus]